MDSTADMDTESWCSVHLPAQHPPAPTDSRTRDPKNQAAKQERVAAWLDQLCTVRYEPKTPEAGRLCRASADPVLLDSDDERPPPPTNRRPRRRMSDASLADFLRCTGPYRPSFLDRRKPEHYPSATRGAALSASDSAVCCQRQRQSTKRRHKPHRHSTTAKPSLQNNGHGTTAKPLLQNNGHDAATKPLLQNNGQSTAAKQPQNNRQSTADARLGSEPYGYPCPSAGGSAEFLGLAFHHFVAFQPLDFAPRSPVATQTESAPFSGAAATIASAGLANIRSYFSAVIDEFAHDTMLIQ